MEASQAFIVNYLWPIMSVIFAVIILKEPLTRRKCLAIAISFFGILTVTGNEILNFNTETLLGAALCALGAVAYGLYTALNKKWQYDDLVTIKICSLATFILTLIINAFSGEIIIPNSMELLGFIWNGGFVMGIATVTWGLATRSGDTAKISNLAYLTPFISMVFTYFVLDEKIKPLSIIGLLIIILGIFIQLKDKKN
jgi:drug/metabolite transporter (DMT)-like permease